MTVREGAPVTRDELVRRARGARRCRRACCSPATSCASRCSTRCVRRGEGYRVVGELANTDRIMNDAFWIGVYPGMTEEMLAHMAGVLTDAVRG